MSIGPKHYPRKSKRSTFAYTVRIISIMRILRPAEILCILKTCPVQTTSQWLSVWPLPKAEETWPNILMQGSALKPFTCYVRLLWEFKCALGSFQFKLSLSTVHLSLCQIARNKYTLDGWGSIPFIRTVQVHIITDDGSVADTLRL